MGKISPPKPVCLVVALMAQERRWLDKALKVLSGEFGPVEFESQTYQFNFSSYYSEEMGEGLIKKFVSFQRLIDPSQISNIKVLTNQIEQDLGERREGKLMRTVNIDPGYLSLSKLVLASTKNAGHRIYLGRGIFAEVTLRYISGEFKKFDWTYPDYQTELAGKFFKKVRNILKTKVK